MALLRLVLEKLCVHIYPFCSKNNLNEKIAILVKNGLSDDLQRAFDFIRISGNEAIHGLDEIDADRAPEIAEASFKLINIIVEKTITEPRQIEDLYNSIPQNYRDNIETRDKKAKETT